MHDFETLRRSLRRNLLTQHERSSLPFISGDSYKLNCDLEITSNFKNEFAINLQEYEDSSPNSSFISGDNVEEFAEWISNQSELPTSLGKLVIHNSDYSPRLKSLNSLLDRFSQIFTVNLLDESERIHPIPIGLENARLLRNGMPADYARLISENLAPKSKRNIQILNNYSESTNFEIRSKANEFFRGMDGVFDPQSFLTPRQYRKLVANSKFVVSPPGNGVDCHRTWEAIYLGAVPIVLRKFWPFSKYSLPVMIVDNWEEVPDRLDEEFAVTSVEEIKSKFFDSLFY